MITRPHRHFSRRRLRMLPLKFNASHLCRILGVSTGTVAYWRLQGLPCKQTSRRGCVLERQAVVQWLWDQRMVRG